MVFHLIVYPLVDPLVDLLLLTLHGWGIMIGLVLFLATLQVLKLLHNKVHVFPQLDLTSYHGVE